MLDKIKTLCSDFVGFIKVIFFKKESSLNKDELLARIKRDILKLADAENLGKNSSSDSSKKFDINTITNEDLVILLESFILSSSGEDSPIPEPVNEIEEKSWIDDVLQSCIEDKDTISHVNKIREKYIGNKFYKDPVNPNRTISKTDPEKKIRKPKKVTASKRQKNNKKS